MKIKPLSIKSLKHLSQKTNSLLKNGGKQNDIKVTTTTSHRNVFLSRLRKLLLII